MSPLHSTRQGRERILIFGPLGASKSTTFFNIARWHQRTNSPAHFYVQDSDNNALDMLEEGYPELTNMTIYPVYDYQDYYSSPTTGIKAIKQLVKPDDWIITDFVGDVWDASQRTYTEQIFGTDITSFFTEARLEMERYNQSIAGKKDVKPQKKSDTFEGRKDWTIINRMHNDYITELCLRQKCHVLSTAKSKAVGDDAEQQNKDAYGRFGVMPHGQKFLGNNYRTVLLSQKLGAVGHERFMMNSIKDRERQLLVGAEVKDFTMTYLKNIAGWSMT